MRICWKVKMNSLFFLSILVLTFTLNWKKRKGKMKEDYFKYIFPKKKNSKGEQNKNKN